MKDQRLVGVGPFLFLGRKTVVTVLSHVCDTLCAAILKVSFPQDSIFQWWIALFPLIYPIAWNTEYFGGIRSLLSLSLALLCLACLFPGFLEQPGDLAFNLGYRLESKQFLLD